MAFIPAEVFKQLRVPLSMWDRMLLGAVIAIFIAMAIAFAAVVIWTAIQKSEGKHAADSLFNTLMWAGVMVFIFVAGRLEGSRQILRALVPPPPMPAAPASAVVVQSAPAAEPSELAEDVQETKEIVIETAKDVRAVKKATKK